MYWIGAGVHDNGVFAATLNTTITSDASACVRNYTYTYEILDAASESIGAPGPCNNGVLAYFLCANFHTPASYAE